MLNHLYHKGISLILNWLRRKQFNILSQHVPEMIHNFDDINQQQVNWRYKVHQWRCLMLLNSVVTKLFSDCLYICCDFFNLFFYNLVGTNFRILMSFFKTKPSLVTLAVQCSKWCIVHLHQKPCTCRIIGSNNSWSIIGTII